MVENYTADEDHLLGYWNDNPGFFHPEGFHLWGNLRYAESYFSEELGALLKKTSMFRARLLVANPEEFPFDGKIAPEKIASHVCFSGV